MSKQYELLSNAVPTNRRYKNKKKSKKKKRKSKTRKRNIKNKKGGGLTGEILKNEIHFDLNRRSRYCREDKDGKARGESECNELNPICTWGQKKDFWGNPRCSKNNDWLNENTTKNKFGRTLNDSLKDDEIGQTQREKRRKKRRKGTGGETGRNRRTGGEDFGRVHQRPPRTPALDTLSRSNPENILATAERIREIPVGDPRYRVRFGPDESLFGKVPTNLTELLNLRDFIGAGGRPQEDLGYFSNDYEKLEASLEANRAIREQMNDPEVMQYLNSAGKFIGSEERSTNVHFEDGTLVID